MAAGVEGAQVVTRDRAAAHHDLGRGFEPIDLTDIEIVAEAEAAEAEEEAPPPKKKKRKASMVSEGDVVEEAAALVKKKKKKAA